MKKILLALVSLTMVIGVLGCDLIEVEIKVKFNEQVKAIHATPGTNETAYKIDSVSSSDTSVLTAELKGDAVTLTSKKAGTVTVTFLSVDYAKKAECTVNVSESGDITESLYKLKYYTYDKTSAAATTYSIWKDNPGTLDPEITKGVYTKNTDSTSKLYIKGDIVYCFTDCDKETWKWVRGVIVQDVIGEIDSIDWKTKGSLAVQDDSKVFYNESTWSSGWLHNNLTSLSEVDYSIAGTSKVLTIDGVAYTWASENP